MIYIELPHGCDNRPLPFYLATEEYVASIMDRLAPETEAFFMWQVRPTVIVGRNQLIDSEVDLDYCRREGIDVWRRKSGGGAVYADRDNIMLSYVTLTADDVPTTFVRYTRAVAAMLRRLGLDAEATGRNDVSISGGKVSGNAFYHLPRHSIAHGTMLYDTDLKHMARALTPPAGKLRSKGVASVPARITTIREHIDITIDDFMRHIRRSLCGDVTARLTAGDVTRVEDIMQEYLRPEFITGRNPRATAVRHARIEGVGQFDISIEMNHGVIADVTMAGDFFVLGDIDTRLVAPLRGCPLDADALTAALAGVDVARVIHGLSAASLVAMLVG